MPQAMFAAWASCAGVASESGWSWRTQPEPILPLRARAELIAGLQCVAYVIAAGSDMPDILNAIDERARDTERARGFAQHVLARHNAT